MATSLEGATDAPETSERAYPSISAAKGSFVGTKSLFFNYYCR
jgi:hypothetical protein